MSRKSNKLFAILVIPLSIDRDMKITEIVGGHVTKYTDRKYICGGQSLHGTMPLFYFSGNFSRIRTWKTLKGCQNFFNYMKSNMQVLELDPYDLDMSIYNWKNVSYEIVSIEEEWNNHVMKEIDREIKRHIDILEKLDKSLIK